jgi:predicted nucleic acid-binding Zn ribbon protein
MLYEQRDDKFCSQNCAVINNNKKRSKTIKYCLHCKKEFKNKPKIKFCSRKCYKLFTLNTQRKRVESGKANYRTVKRYLLNTKGHKCSNCGLTTWQHVSIPLVLDHKDGNHKNNTIANCRLLCNNCDALTPTYKGRNRGNGRHYRRLRYSQGKSF